MRKQVTLCYFLLNVVFAYSQVIEFEDENLKNALVNDKVVDADLNHTPEINVDTNRDGEIQFSEAAKVTRLYITKKKISSLKGLEHFTNLETLYCSHNNIKVLQLTNPSLKYIHINYNQLTTINVSALKKLNALTCSDNKLMELDVRKNKALELLYCDNNNLQKLATENPYLTELNCQNNKLKALDVRKNKTLKMLACENNLITYLDLSKNKNITEVFCKNNDLIFLNLKNGNNLHLETIEVQNNKHLKCIQVDKPKRSNKDIYWEKDDQTRYAKKCK